MKLIECANAYAALVELAQSEWGYFTAYVFALLKRELSPHVEFFLEKEKELVLAFGRRNEDGEVEYADNGRFYFESSKGAAEYLLRHKELENMEADLSWERKVLPPPEKIRPAHLEALMPFIDFGGGEENGV